MALEILDEYKELLISFYVHECDNSKSKLIERKKLLSQKYSDEFLWEVINGTNDFVEKILALSDAEYPGFLNIPLEQEPDIIHISLNLTGGWMSDTIIKDSERNIYSIRILKQIFGNFFIIEPCRVNYKEETSTYEGLEIVSEIPFYFTSIQCDKKLIDKVRRTFKTNSSIKLLKKY